MRNTAHRWITIAALMGLTAVGALATEGDQTDRRIVVSVPDRMLALVTDGEIVKIYPIAVGAPTSPTPSGEFLIIHRITKPTWYKRDGGAVPAGKDNPLGTRWLGVSKPHYGIHGTNRPKSIGKPASGGCIRLHNAHVEELFELVEIGDTVEFHGETNERLAAIFRLPDPTISVTVELAENQPAPVSDTAPEPDVAAGDDE